VNTRRSFSFSYGNRASLSDIDCSRAMQVRRSYWRSARSHAARFRSRVSSAAAYCLASRHWRSILSLMASREGWSGLVKGMTFPPMICRVLVLLGLLYGNQEELCTGWPSFPGSCPMSVVATSWALGSSLKGRPLCRPKTWPPSRQE
jgi:hypothetical protein